MPFMEDLVKYESGKMSPSEETAFIQKLVDSGSAWTLQGYYQRVARMMIRGGSVKDTHGVAAQWEKGIGELTEKDRKNQEGREHFAIDSTEN